MAEYLISFNDDWVPDLSLDDLAARSRVLRPLIADMQATGVLLFTGGLDDEAPVFSVDLVDGAPRFADGYFRESVDRIGGFAVIDVATEAEAREWAGKIAVGCGWPQEVRRFQVRGRFADGAP